MESDQELNYSLISEAEINNFEDSEISNIEVKSEECELDFSYHTHTINLTEDVISDTLSDIDNDSSIADIGNNEIVDDDVGILRLNLVTNEESVENSSSSLQTNKTEKKFHEEYDYCPVGKLNNNNESFVSSHTANSSTTSGTYLEPTDDDSILEKIDSIENALHEFNDRIKILKVESFINDCNNTNKIVYKIQQLKSKKEDLGVSNDQSTLSDLLSSIQALNQQTLIKISQLEERLGVLENIMLGRSTSDQLETKIKGTSNIEFPQNKKDAGNLMNSDDEAIAYGKHYEFTNMTSKTENEKNRDEDRMLEDEGHIYQHEESSNVMISWNENTIENNLLLTIDPTDVSCEQNDKNTGEENLLMTEDNSMMIEDKESIHQFEEWLDSPFSGLGNENISPPSSFGKVEDLPIVKSTSCLNIEMIGVKQKDLFDFSEIDSKPLSTETTILKRPAVKMKELSVVLERIAIPVPKKKSIKSTPLLKVQNSTEDNDSERKINLEEELPVYSCALCKCKFTNVKQFYNHAESHTSNRNIGKSNNQCSFKCRYCSFATMYASHLQLHKRKHIYKINSKVVC